MRFSIVFAILACAPAAFAQADAFQIAYVSNLNQGDSYVNITNGGAYGAFLGLNGSNGDVCVNLYIFDPAQEMLACCSCSVTPDGLNSFSVKNDLINKTLTPAVPTSIVIKMFAIHLASTCSAGTSEGDGAASIRAWATTLHQNSQSGYSVTENAFQQLPQVSGVERDSLVQMCGFVLAEGSQQFGFCNNACTNNGLAGAKK